MALKSGIIVINKPSEFTSFDVIAKLRGILHTRKLGHAGTLDPMATGVLPVFVEKATKACDILPNETKSYKAGFKLGLKTNTLDIWGEKLEEEIVSVEKENVLKALQKFLGEISQIPPMFSAVSVGGKRLYELARDGKEIERPSRVVKVFKIDLLEYDDEKAEGILEIFCSKGTYIRTLISDLGESLGTYGTMTSLIRTSSSGFNIENSYTLEDIEKIKDNEDRLNEIIISTEEAFLDYEKIVLDERLTRLYKNGVKLRLEQVKITEDKTYTVFGFDNEFLGLANSNIEKDELRSIRNFYKM